MGPIAYGINPDLLKWAREKCGFTMELISRRLNKSMEELRGIEKGDLSITLAQLRKLAGYYKRPTSFFYLSKIPEERELPDFRIKRKVPIPQRSDESLHIKIRKFHEKKKNAEFLARKLDYNDIRYDFIKNIDVVNDLDAYQKIRDLFGIDNSELQSLKDYDVLNYWKDKLEEKNILIFQFTNIGVDVTSGFVFTELPFPLIAINQKDSYYARVFTLIHEFCHILLKKDALCKTDVLDENSREIETICNRVSASVLVPEDELKSTLKKIETMDMKEAIKELSDYFKVSYSVILYRLKAFNLISQSDFMQNERWIEDIQERNRNRNRSRVSGPSRMDYYVVYFASNSTKYLTMVFESLNKVKISYYEAMKFVGKNSSDKFENLHEKYVEKYIYGGSIA